MQITLPGKLSEHATGIVMKELVRRAMEIVRLEQYSFEAKAKESAYKVGEDFVTSADYAAQNSYSKSLQECFPDYGVVGEENSLSIKGKGEAKDYFFTVDPLDGTKAYIRRQSHGIGTMLSLVHKDKVIGAFIGDVMTDEIYGFRPGSEKVFRIHSLENAELLGIDPNKRLAEQYILLRDLPSLHSPRVVQMADTKPLFKGTEVMGGSIGTSMARLWKGEVGGAVLRAGSQTPWDFCPIAGITKTMGFVFLKPDPKREGFYMEFEPLISAEIYPIEHEILIIHHSRLAELEEWCKKTK